MIPTDGFSWIDRRFVRDGFIGRLPGEAILLYFFLVAVSDAQGLSFYADPTIGKILKLNPEEISQARARLIAAQLILHRYPLYQVLSLPEKQQEDRPRPGCDRRTQDGRGGDPVSLSEILEKAREQLRGPDNDRRS
jgi:hypothetical protein